MKNDMPSYNSDFLEDAIPYPEEKLWLFQIKDKKSRPNMSSELSDAMQMLLYKCACSLGIIETDDSDAINIREAVGKILKNQSIETLLNILYNSNFPKCFSVFMEIGYVDRLYRDTYYTHYSGKHFFEKRDCDRILFFKGEFSSLREVASMSSKDDFIGSCVLQPNGVIGRTYLSPKYLLPQHYYVRTANYECTVQGYTFTIDAFPYMMQDREATTCAEVTLLNLIGYYSRRYDEYPLVLPSDIERLESQYGTERVFPSRGISYADVARMLASIGLSPRLYSYRAPKTSLLEIKRYMYYYTESAIPFGIAVDSYPDGLLHSIVCIGHGPIKDDWLKDSVTNYLWSPSVGDCEGDSAANDLRDFWMANSADACDEFVVMDDGNKPYSQITVSKGTSFCLRGEKSEKMVEHLCVPLYKKTFLEAEGAMEVIISFLLSRMGFLASQELFGLSVQSEYASVGKKSDNPLIHRLFLVSSKTFLNKRIESLQQLVQKGKIDQKVVSYYENTSFPRLVWVCELYSPGSFQAQTPIGEILVDATSKKDGIDGVVLFHYPFCISSRQPDSVVQDLERNICSLKKWTPFPQFCDNLKDFQQS